MTDKQQRILAYMVNNTRLKYPTVRQTAKHFGVVPGTIQDHLDALRRKGLLSDKIDQRLEIRNEPGTQVLDEVVVRGAESVHFERMSDTAIWCGIRVGGKEVRVWICSTNGRAHIDYRAEVEE